MGSDLSVEEAYGKWSDDLVRYATALVGPADAPDLVADAFAAVLASEETWHAVRDPHAYLMRVVTNAARMSWRSSNRRSRRELRWVTGAPAGELIAEPHIRAALDRLSVQQRAVTYLTYWHDLAPDRIAELLGVSPGSVKRQLARARSTLREVLS